MTLKIFFVRTYIFELGNGFPIRNLAWKSGSSVNTLNPTGESISNNSNEHKLSLKESDFQIINKGETTLSENLYEKLSRPVRTPAFAQAGTLSNSKEENKLVDSSRELPYFYEDRKSRLSGRTSAQKNIKLRNFSAKQKNKNEESSSLSNIERRVEKIDKEFEKLIAIAYLKLENLDKDKCDSDNYARKQEEYLNELWGVIALALSITTLFIIPLNHENKKTVHEEFDQDLEWGTDFLNAQNQLEYDNAEAQAHNDSGLELDSGDSKKNVPIQHRRKFPYQRTSEKDFYNQNDRAGESSPKDLSSESEIMEEHAKSNINILK
jgi:hypothetical protein